MRPAAPVSHRTVPCSCPPACIARIGEPSLDCLDSGSRRSPRQVSGRASSRRATPCAGRASRSFSSASGTVTSILPNSIRRTTPWHVHSVVIRSPASPRPPPTSPASGSLPAAADRNPSDPADGRLGAAASPQAVRLTLGLPEGRQALVRRLTSRLPPPGSPEVRRGLRPLDRIAKTVRASRYAQGLITDLSPASSPRSDPPITAAAPARSTVPELAAPCSGSSITLAPPTRPRSQLGRAGGARPLCLSPPGSRSGYLAAACRRRAAQPPLMKNRRGGATPFGY